jgi:hypothetical protein
MGLRHMVAGRAVGLRCTLTITPRSRGDLARWRQSRGTTSRQYWLMNQSTDAGHPDPDHYPTRHGTTPGPKSRPRCGGDALSSSLPSANAPVVGRDSASPVTPDYKSPFAFTGGTIDKVVVDVSGDRYVDHEVQVRAWFWID